MIQIIQIFFESTQEKQEFEQLTLQEISAEMLNGIKNGFRKIKGYNKVKSLQLALERYEENQKKEAEKEEIDTNNETL